MSKPAEEKKLSKRILGFFLILLGIHYTVDTFVVQRGNIFLFFVGYSGIFVGLGLVVASTKLSWGKEPQELQSLNQFEAEETVPSPGSSWRKAQSEKPSLLDEILGKATYKKIAAVSLVILLFVASHIASHRATQVRNGMNIVIGFTPAKATSYLGSDIIGCGSNTAGTLYSDPKGAKYIFDLNWNVAHFRLQNAQGQVVESLGSLGELATNNGTCQVSLSFTKLRDFTAPIYLVDDNGLKFELNATQIANKDIEVVSEGLHL